MIALSMTSSGCATTPPQPEDTGSSASCDASKAERLVGEPRSNAVGAEALRLTGARTLRWVPKGGAITMDYSESRLNIWLDGKNRVERVTCG